MAPSQVTQLQSVMKEESVRAGQTIWRKGEITKDVILVGEGKFYFKELPLTDVDPFSQVGAPPSPDDPHPLTPRTHAPLPTPSTPPCTQGALMVDVYALEHGEKHQLTFMALTDGQIFRIDGDDLLEFLDNNPGAFIWMRDTILVE